MKVLMLGRFDLLEKRGGDTVQVENTAEELRKLGAQVDIGTDLDFSSTAYDLYHVFQLDWIPEMNFFTKKAKSGGKPIVLSPIHHNVDEVKKFDDLYAFDFRRISKVLFNDQFKRDTFKNVYRCFIDARRISPTFYSVTHGFKNMQKQMLTWADHVLVQTNKEVEDLKKTFGVDFKWTKIPNGVGNVYLDIKDMQNPLDFTDYLICVGRIEPRKNQIHIIEAVRMLRQEKGIDFKLVFIGRFGERKHFGYTQKFKKELENNPWIKHIESVKYNGMPAYYKYAKVCVSASWFETTGLTSLEALFCGTNTVAAGERAQEYLGSLASYCEPDKVFSIKEAINKEYSAPRPSISEDMKKEYTWENAAKKTLEVYKRLVK